MDQNQPYMNTGYINQVIDNFLENEKFQNNLENLIINSLSNKKIISLSRTQIADKIVSSDFIRLFEQDLLENMLQTLEINKIDKNELIIKNKNLQIKKKEIIDLNSNLDSLKIFNILVEEFLTCDDPIKLENYIGDLSNFESTIITTHEKIENILNKISDFLRDKIKSEDNYLVPNLLNFINKLLKTCQTKVLIDTLQMFLIYFNNLVEKFFKGNFDITKFYKISLNLECMNNLIMKIPNDDIILRKMDESKIKIIVIKLIQIFLKNYGSSNPVFIDNNKSQVQEFGISTNYILLLLFNLDKDMCAFKILLRNSADRI